MGQSIDLYSYDYEKLANKIMEVVEIQEREMVDKILLACGNKIHDRYVILNQELWDGYSCYYNVMRVLEKVFKVEDMYGAFYSKDVDKKELIQAMEKYEIYDAIEMEELEYEEE